ncbi:hypothetical protein PRIPAC_95796 [Pristionchus pacificus]|uniref:G_PROTEIN_RECEP_F1_2 domain-containing protein n=1 Tax=Pristionchus pacificus TaxID=54126 RepID=A0A2A6BJA3_PRIPA|nr:hypothetical protein PRIPAC_95796 [Pristionchus pacificus]|eukprot:PDM65994.1 hypothetical protein PRIPAC_44088 [Pristionchus pacificus]
MSLANSSGPSSNSLATWMFVSQLQYWVVLVVVLLTLPLIIIGLLRLRREVTCKVTPFLMNIAACFANWTFVVMFAQRFAILLFPMKQMMQQGCIGFLLDARRLLAVALLFSITTQSWALFMMTDRVFEDEKGNPMVTCETDPTRIDPTTATWLSILEMASTYLLPFICTLIVDLGVLIWSKHFTTTFNETIISRNTDVSSTGRATSRILFRGLSSASTKSPRTRSNSDQESGMKIQSAEHIRLCNKKRGKAIKRCLMMATAQVLINLPYHTLQVFDEIYDFTNDQDWFAFYFYADALMYLIYLLQYPAVLVHIEFLISDTARNNKKSPLIPGSRNTI